MGHKHARTHHDYRREHHAQSGDVHAKQGIGTIARRHQQQGIVQQLDQKPDYDKGNTQRHPDQQAGNQIAFHNVGSHVVIRTR